MRLQQEVIVSEIESKPSLDTESAAL
jgi:hypothetical protein